MRIKTNHSSKAGVYFLLIFVGAGLISLGAWATNVAMPVIERVAQGLAPEAVPTAPYDYAAPEVVIPILENGVLSLSRVERLADGATTTTERSRQVVAENVTSLQDVNRLTGQYLFQTTDDSHGNDFSRITTWLGGASGKAERVVQGLGIKLSPSGAYVAAMVGKGDLKILNVQGKELATFGPAGYPVFSADGTKLAFFRMVMRSPEDSGGLTVVDLASGNTLATYFPDQNQYTPLAFSEDGDTLFFAADTKSQLNDPTNLDRVDIYALQVLGGVPRLVTTGTEKLPYIEYSRAQYLSNAHRLVLAADNTVWIVDTQTGGVKSIPNIADVFSLDSVEALATRSNGNGTTSKTWNALIVQ